MNKDWRRFRVVVVDAQSNHKRTIAKGLSREAANVTAAQLRLRGSDAQVVSDDPPPRGVALYTSLKG